MVSSKPCNSCRLVVSLNAFEGSFASSLNTPKPRPPPVANWKWPWRHRSRPNSRDAAGCSLPRWQTRMPWWRFLPNISAAMVSAPWFGVIGQVGASMSCQCLSDAKSDASDAWFTPWRATSNYPSHCVTSAFLDWVAPLSRIYCSAVSIFVPHSISWSVNCPVNFCSDWKPRPMFTPFHYGFVNGDTTSFLISYWRFG